MSRGKKKKQNDNNYLESLPLFAQIVNPSKPTTDGTVVSPNLNRGGLDVVGHVKAKVVHISSRTRGPKLGLASETREKIIKSHIAFADSLDW
jgi:hypothetical protein